MSASVGLAIDLGYLTGALAVIAFMPAWATGHDLPRTKVVVEDHILSKIA